MNGGQTHTNGFGLHGGAGGALRGRSEPFRAPVCERGQVGVSWSGEAGLAAEADLMTCRLMMRYRVTAL